MFFEVEHEFDAPVDAVAAAMFHPDYDAFLLARHDVLEGLVQQTRDEDTRTIRRRIHYKPTPAFERIGPRKIPPEWFEFIQESTWDKGARTLSFHNLPLIDKVARRFTSRGNVQLSELLPGKTVRRAHAEVKVHNLPFMLRPLTGVAEQMLAREARKLLETEARVLTEWLAQHATRP